MNAAVSHASVSLSLCVSVSLSLIVAHIRGDDDEDGGGDGGKICIFNMLIAIRCGFLHVLHSVLSPFTTKCITVEDSTNNQHWH